MKINWDDVTVYLNHFDHKQYTFQFLKNNKPAGYAVLDKDNLKPLEKAHREGKEVFLMVNEGDGVIHPDKKIPRSQDNVIGLNCCFIDTDDAPAKQVTAYLKAHRIKPHLIVETSPGKFHYYIFLETIQFHGDQKERSYYIARWKRIQRTLSYLDTPQAQTDKGAQIDISRVLRVPGFLHLKNKEQPFSTQIRKVYNHRSYPLDELEELLGVSPTSPDAQAQTFQTALHTPYLPATAKVNKGNRHGETTQFLGSLLSKGVAPEFALQSFYHYVESKFEEPALFLPGGARNQEVQDFVKYKLEDLEREKQAIRIEESTQVLKSRENTQDPFALPDSFYTSQCVLPLVQDISTHLTDQARYPAPSLFFAAALSYLGTIKAQHYKTNLGHAPSNYFLCLAPSGSGKNYAQEVLSHTSQRLSLQNLIRTGIRSDKGIARFLESTGGKGLLIIDEAEGFFSSLQDTKNTPHYLLACKSLFLELYTSTNTPHKHLGETGDKRAEPIVLSYPQINLLFHGVSHVLTQNFDSKSIQDGLLQRFLIVTHFAPRVLNENAKPAGPLPDHILNTLQDIVIKCKFNSERDYNELQNRLTDLKALESDNSEEAQESRSKLKQEIQSIKAAQQGRKIILKFTPEAKRLYKAFSTEMDNRANQEILNLTGREGLFTRAAEQVGRLAAAGCFNRVDTSSLEYLIQFVTSRVEAVNEVSKHSHQKELTGNVSKDLDDLVNFVAVTVRKKNGVPASKRDIVRGFKIREARIINSLLSEAVNMGALKVHTINSKGIGRTGTGYSVA